MIVAVASDSHVSSLTPFGAPGILNDPERFATGRSVAHKKNCMVVAVARNILSHFRFQGEFEQVSYTVLLQVAS
jgi:hypothetical protein